MVQETSPKSVHGVMRSLAKGYSVPSPPRRVVDCIVAVIIARETSLASARRACSHLMKRFVDWNEVRVSRTGEVERALHPFIKNGRAVEVARTLIYCLQQVFMMHGNLGLDEFARERPDALGSLMADLGCLTKEESALVMMLGLGQSVMPIDGDMLKAGKRMGFIRRTATKVQARHALENVLDGSNLYVFYHALREHSRRVCLTDSPECDRCSVRRACKHAKRRRQ